MLQKLKKWIGVSVLCIFTTFGGMLAIGSTAYAAVPPIVGTTLTTVQADGLAVIDLVWPVVVVIFGGILLMKIFKRAANKV